MNRGSISLGDFVLMQSGGDIVHHVLPCTVVIIQTGFLKKLFNNRDIKLNRALLSACGCEVDYVSFHNVFVVENLCRWQCLRCGQINVDQLKSNHGLKAVDSLRCQVSCHLINYIVD